MSELKTPDLNSVHQNYIRLIEPLLTKTQWQSAQEKSLEFVNNEALVLQQILQNDILTKGTYAKYLAANRIDKHLSAKDTPVSLSSNLGLRINWRSHTKGIMRLAEFISSALLTHKHFLDKDLTKLQGLTKITERKRQWQFLQGGARCPAQNKDTLFVADPDRVLKNIGVFWQYRFFILPVMNKNNQLLGTEQIAQALEKLLKEEVKEAEVPFASLSFAGKNAFNLLQKLLTNKQNQQAYQLINETLFTITIKEEEVFSDSFSAMEDATYGHGVELWAYKPLNYIFYLADDGLFLHSESSWVNVQGLIELLTINQQNLDKNLIERNRLPFPGKASFREISWYMEDKDWRNWLMAITEYDKKLELYAFSGIEVEVKRLNQDAQVYDFLMQTILAAGYLRAFGRLRNLTAFYDWSKFDYPWLGDIQPISQELLVLIEKLFEKSAHIDDFNLALKEHQRRKQLLNSGISCLLYLKELENASKRQKRSASFFQEPGFKIISQTFVSSFSQGIDSLVKDIGFAPPHLNGIGINYAFTGTSWRFLMSHSKANQLLVNQFMLGIEEAWLNLDALLNGELHNEDLSLSQAQEVDNNEDDTEKKPGLMSRILGRKSSGSSSSSTENFEANIDDDDDW